MDDCEHDWYPVSIETDRVGGTVYWVCKKCAQYKRTDTYEVN